jgi:nitrate reductase NapE component
VQVQFSIPDGSENYSGMLMLGSWVRTSSEIQQLKINKMKKRYDPDEQKSEIPDFIKLLIIVIFIIISVVCILTFVE